VAQAYNLRNTKYQRKLLINNPNKVVEAAGVEPASEKARHEKTTCVARF
jgi:hypothetical protein